MARFALLLTLLLSSGAAILAQSTPWYKTRPSIGVIAGTSLTDNIQSGESSILSADPLSTFRISSAPRSSLVGAVVEFKLPRLFALEFNAIRRPVGYDIYQQTFPTEPGLGSATELHLAKVRATDWEFPVLAKYRFVNRKLTPFLTLGPSFRKPGLGFIDSHFGATGGLGLEARIWRMKISPTFRYTRWQQRSQRTSVRPEPNQIEFLVGFTF